jgi:hypothetical protein
MYVPVEIDSKIWCPVVLVDLKRIGTNKAITRMPLAGLLVPRELVQCDDDYRIIAHGIPVYMTREFYKWMCRTIMF